MIKKFNKIKNLGIFSDYTASSSLPDFKRYNLIYGWNGSGKTTLTRLFSALETGSLDKYNDLEYEIATEDGDVVLKIKQQEAFSKKVRVFNQEYIENNLTIRNGKAKSITLILGEVGKEVSEQIDKDTIELKQKEQKLSIAEKAKKKSQTEKGSKFTDVAKIIYSSILGGPIRTYIKTNAESDFDKLSEKKILSKEELDKFLLVVKQEMLDLVPEIRFPQIQDKDGNLRELEDVVSNLVGKRNSLLSQTVESITIARLRENADISEWVETGLGLHKAHPSEICEFCTQKLPVERIQELAKFFNEADQKLKSDIDLFNDDLRKIYSTVSSLTQPAISGIYKEMHEAYQAETDQFLKAKNYFLDSITKTAELLKEKKTRTTEVVVSDIEIPFADLNSAFAKVNAVIKKHNEKTADFNTQKTVAAEQIKNHHLSGIFDEVKKLKDENSDFEKEISFLENGNPETGGDLGIEALRKRIAENQAKISSTHKACDDINNELKNFLGRDELTFEPYKIKALDENGVSVEMDDGYIIKRCGKEIDHLSEGEKTAVAFVYFIIHLNEQGFKLKEGIIVMDDPISSLDLSLNFRVCAYIEKHIRSAHQVFLLTHNYDFFNQVKKWFFGELNQDKDITKHTGEFFMIKNGFSPTLKQRFAEIAEIDPLLRDYESEYHYLFKKLVSFSEENPNIEAVYDYPNMARKFLECFLAFRIPKKASFKVRVLSLKEINKDISSDDLSHAYNFVNSHSHLDTKTGLLQFDPTLTLSGKDSIECVLRIISQADKKHYEFMEKAVK